jgi:predicted transcriptional regulator
MKRTTISLPDDVADAVEREARRRRVSVSYVVRETLAQRLGRTTGRRELAIAALGRSGHRTTARDAEEVLAAEWDARDR